MGALQNNFKTFLLQWRGNESLLGTVSGHIMIPMFEEHPLFVCIFRRHLIMGIQFCGVPYALSKIFCWTFFRQPLVIIIINILGRDGHEQWAPRCRGYPRDNILQTINHWCPFQTNTEDCIELSNTYDLRSDSWNVIENPMHSDTYPIPKEVLQHQCHGLLDVHDCWNIRFLDRYRSRSKPGFRWFRQGNPSFQIP